MIAILTARQHLLGRERCEELYSSRDDARPTSLMTGADARAIIAMIIFVKEQIVAPVPVVLEFLCTTKDRAPAIAIAKKDRVVAAGNFFGDLVQRHHSATASRTFYLKIFAVVSVVMQHGPNDESVNRRPDRAAPVAITFSRCDCPFGSLKTS